METKEIRAFNFEVKAEETDRGKQISGRAIVFDSPTDMGWYREIIDDGALTDTDLRDVRFLVNHNTDMIPLARSRNNNANSTMQLEVVPGGGMDIRVNLDTENNSDARSLYSATEREDITGMSFMMLVGRDRWEDLETDYPTRHIEAINKVLEVSAVTFPAYAQTTLTARGLEDALESAKTSLESARAEAREAALMERRRKTIKILLEV